MGNKWVCTTSKRLLFTDLLAQKTVCMVFGIHWH